MILSIFCILFAANEDVGERPTFTPAPAPAPALLSPVSGRTGPASPSVKEAKRQMLSPLDRPVHNGSPTNGFSDSGIGKKPSTSELTEHDSKKLSP